MNRRLLALVATIVAITLSRPSISAETPAPNPIGERIFRFLDKNSNKSIDPGEFHDFSASMKIWLNKRGFDGTKPISHKDFVAIAEQMMNDLRKGRSRVGVAPPARTGSVPPTKVVAKPAAVAPPEKIVPPTMIERTIAPGTAALPVEFQETDLDRDGQIDFFEWRKTRRTEMARFYQLDANRDSVLSLAELTQGQPAATPTTPATTTPTVAGGTGTPTSAATPAGGTPAATTPTGPSPQRLEYIKWAIGQMDKNKNSKIDPEEWNGSRRIGPAFKKANIDLTKAMTEAEFVANYQKAFPEKPEKSKFGSSRRR